MSRRIETLYGHAFPNAPEWSAIADAWSSDAVESMLSLVWDGYDQMKSKILSKVDFTQPIHQLERALTSAHATEITKLWKASQNGFESFLPKHEPWEQSSITSPSAMPPSYDFGFENVNDPRLLWPIEAKVLANPDDVKRYLDDLNLKYLSGKGAPFSTEAGLLGYLREGQAIDAIESIQKALGTNLKLFPPFANRLHHISEHPRSMPGIQDGAGHIFVCHQMIAPLT
jgi:hypothetical protein